MTQSRLVDAEVRAAPRPVHVVWELTLACDLGCVHCGSRAGTARETELTTAQCLETIEAFAEAGVTYISLIGGEAYLREDWLEIIAAIRAAGIDCGMVTGALNMTPEMIQAADEAGLWNVSVSIDGIGKTHDMQRGRKGSFDAAIAAAKRFAASDINLSVNTQINRLTAAQLPEVAALLVELGATAWQVQLPELLLQPYDLLELFPLLVSIKHTILDPNGIHLAPANNIGYFGPYESELRTVNGEASFWTGCPAGEFVLGLESDGRLKGCPSLDTSVFAGGKITEKPLDELMQEPAVRQLVGRTVEDLWGYCKSCYYNDMCLGGCSWTAQSVMGRAGNNPYCFHRAEDLARQGLRERIVHVEPAPDEPFSTGRFELIEEPCETEVPSLVDWLEAKPSALLKRSALTRQR